MLKLKNNYIERHDRDQNMSIRTTSIFKLICNIKYKLILGIKVEKMIFTIEKKCYNGKSMEDVLILIITHTYDILLNHILHLLKVNSETHPS